MNKKLLPLVMFVTLLVIQPADGCVAETTGSFTFRRVKPPEPGQGRLLNIQVTPVEQEKPVLSHRIDISIPQVEEESTAPANLAGATSEWFWQEISPALQYGSSLRMAEASALLGRKPTEAGLMRQSPDKLKQILENYGVEILKATAGTQVSPALVLSVIAVESGGRSDAVSSAGAAGLMQLMPATAARFGVTERNDAAQNIMGGVKYLDWLLDEFDGDAIFALAAYNAGEGAVQRSGGVPNYPETRLYVPKVIAAWQTARALCLTPPVRATDGCFFAGLRIASE